MSAQVMSSQIVVARSGLPMRRASSARIVASPFSKKSLVTKANQHFVVRASATEQNVDVEQVVKDLQDKWEKVENKPAFIIYSVAAFSAIWLSSTVINALNSVPLFPKLFELVGLGYSAWFTYRYLLFKSSREELVADIEQLKKKISGEQ